MVSTTAGAETAESTSSPSSNPMLDQDGLPRFSSIEPSQLPPAVTELLEKLEADFSAMESKLSEDDGTSYDEVLPAVERLQEPLGYVWGVAGHLNGVKNGDELREAYEKNQPGVVQAMTKFSQSRPLYDALKGIESSWEDATGKDVEFEEGQRRRAVSNSLRSMTLGGVGLEGEEKEKFNDMRMRLAELATKFGNHVLDATKAFSLTIEDAADVEGVPASAKAMWAQSHAMHLKSEDPEADVPEPDAEKGPWRVTLDGPSYIAALSHLPNRSQRETVYRASVSRASDLGDEDKNNVPLIYEILSIKKDMSTMLGFDNFAEQSLAGKMAPTVEAVTELTDLVAEKAIPAAKKELAEITDLARSVGGDDYAEDSLEKLQPWDVTFWSERLKEKKFDLTEEELRPYFALPAVLDGMFGLVKRIFNIEVTAADGEAEVWNDDVRFFKVNDVETGKHIASFYLDPYSRPADKRGGAWMDVCLGKSEACNRDVPVAYLTCNGSPPVGDDTPSLMTFREVETLFHEFGHGLQHMLTTASVGDVAGINGVEWDAVELPSQFMENWCYDKPTVYGFAKHYETGEPLPEDMFEKLKEQKTYGAGMMSCRQLYFGQMDMELHSSFDPKKEGEEDESIFDVQRRVAARYIPHSPPLPEDRFLCTFNHIFGGGYAAGYYSYKWAEVMSADAFGAFEDVGLDDEEKVKEVGMRFRDTVLSLGGGVEPMEVFRRFRGREPSPEALLRHNGLA
uniref:oligopeptidase A n=1 Tax=Odontella aurita TaxID=265563 RepID=A0A6U6EF43_9STRA